ncbi:MAG: hypothetical protein GPJ54_21115 [Candidatus Heimdallarchaeota archaeon]|nr:hypothetical protein [Candidatus Heimdallarchaeota archaeon]
MGNKNKKQKVIKSLILISMFMTLSRTPAISGEVIWSEIFDVTSEDNWEMMSYYAQSGVMNGILEPHDELVSIKDGKLQSPDLSGDKYWAIASHNSSVAYGKWSFDWHISENNQSFDSVAFVSNDELTNYNWVGLRSNERGLSDYGVALGSYSVPNYDSFYPGISLVYLKSGVPFKYENLKFDSDQSGIKHIVITRDIDGKIEVDYNSEFTLSFTDQSLTTSDKFLFTSWVGNSSIDNIVVSDDISDDHGIFSEPSEVSTPISSVQSESSLSDVASSSSQNSDSSNTGEGSFSAEFAITSIVALLIKIKKSSRVKQS